MSEYFKPLPKPRPRAVRSGRPRTSMNSRLQKCGACSQFIYYPRDRCPNCFSDQLSWQHVSGRGKLYSYTTVYRASTRSFADAPYVLAIVELDEGPRMTTNMMVPQDQLQGRDAGDGGLRRRDQGSHAGEIQTGVAESVSLGLRRSSMSMTAIESCPCDYGDECRVTLTPAGRRRFRSGRFRRRCPRRRSMRPARRVRRSCAGSSGPRRSACRLRR